MMTELEKHYNKFNEDKRLTRRRGQVEFITSLKYIHECIDMLFKEKSETSDEIKNENTSIHDGKIDEINNKNASIHDGKIDETKNNEAAIHEDKTDETKNDEAAIHEDKTDKNRNADIKILDVGAGTGRYSIHLAQEGYDVTAIELVKYNLGILKSKGSNVKAYQGTALNLSRFKDESFDITLVFGPMYHLFTLEDKLKALSEAKRVTKKGGYLLIAYYMNEYGVLTHGFIDGQIKESIANGKLTDDFHCIAEPEDLYERVRTEDILNLNERLNLQRVKLIATDGPAHYIRQTLNSMDEETFQIFLNYHLSTCERQDLIGASTHTLDIIKV